ncbi:hypothetical protein J2Q11_12360 [Tenacibaculum finnmarkense genomovar finnmarkense]|uniref:hypothetical protein n=1 Tax=Tenacibaculum finnmarkense TaxID=2781243 RepID=UPI001EFBC08B|nr:hypothetical protein [Tenacibaculum finnmarkense]MCG8213582.1 hypothetical protein [Tenacibaculum finnmarkense genomovar finnmarkense]MCG8231923.1 hypothetical protein [Tenacibaculum finnmarkense genomovar finnmarkense]MCG8886463.1 hypothetical protein [Tenacibaculum finnmarkense]MCG8897245.1 hypothetical protein [Tenacibaculum finnmarkense]MCG8903977.1 hypothetical protein [Tenacibaculum finnmarkense]
MNGYELTKSWFNFSFETKEAKPIHTAIYLYAVEHCNKLGWKKEFGLPTDLVMEVLSIRSYKTYSKALKEIVEFGFLKMVEKSKNQWTANIIALSNFKKSENESLGNAIIEAPEKPEEKTVPVIQLQPSADFFGSTKDFRIKVGAFFSQNTEVLEMRMFSFFRTLDNKGEFEIFKEQTEAYMKYKNKNSEKIHGWNSYSHGGEWKEVNWIDKLSKNNTPGTVKKFAKNR